MDKSNQNFNSFAYNENKLLGLVTLNFVILIHVYKHTYRYLKTHTYLNTYIHMYTYICIHICTDACLLYVYVTISNFIQLVANNKINMKLFFSGFFGRKTSDSWTMNLGKFLSKFLTSYCSDIAH